MSAQVEAMFLPARDGGQRFVLYHAPAAQQHRGVVVYLHPFAEEMNKVRRMAALQARSLARAGFAVVQIDLKGCGDSSGDLGDATWQDWKDDAIAAARWLCERYPDTRLWLWGTRAGALLASEAAGEMKHAGAGLLLWAPVLNGQALLQQFLRISTASDMLGGDKRGGLAPLRNVLDSGGTVEVAGYRLPAAVARGLSAARLVPPPSHGPVVWLETSNRETLTLSPAAAAWLEQCREAGHLVRAAAVPGPAFWQTTEIEEAPALLQATVDALQAFVA